MIALYKEYEPETLKKLQKLELDILKEFDKICTKNRIEYFCVGGTAIGAVRHHGFIPWDDDIDVGMLRNDYERFLNVAQKELPAQYELLNPKLNHSFPLMSSKLMLKDTCFQTKDMKNLPIRIGIFIDILCFDFIPDDEKVMKRIAKRVWLKGKLMVLSGLDDPVIFFSGLKALVIRLGCKTIHRIFRLFHLSPYRFYCSIEKDLLQYDMPSKRLAYQFDPQLYTSIISVEDVFPTKRVSFEDMQIKCMGKVEEYLKRRYGDYMKLPPEDKRHNHPPYKLDFGRY